MCNANGSTSSFSINRSYIIAVNNTISNMMAYQNGVLSYTSSSASGVLNGNKYNIIGNQFTDLISGNYPMVGYINEMLFYKGSHTTQQRQMVEGYLAWKWNLQLSLPTNHPYYSIPLGNFLPE